MFILWFLGIVFFINIGSEIDGWFRVDHTVRPGPWTPEESVRRNKALAQMGWR